MIVTERERERGRDTGRGRGRDTGRGRSRLHAPGARRGTRSRDSRIATWAKGRRQTAEPPRGPPGASSDANQSRGELSPVRTALTQKRRSNVLARIWRKVNPCALWVGK